MLPYPTPAETELTEKSAMLRRLVVPLVLLLVGLIFLSRLFGQAPPERLPSLQEHPNHPPVVNRDVPARLEQQFAARTLPLLKQHCWSCHNTEKTEASLNLAQFDSQATISANYQLWTLILERIEAGEMPPKEARSQPTATERASLVFWIRTLHDYEASLNAEDPGVVLARRLSSSELDYTIRDLTGVDLRPAREFPVDPANTAGFDNSGESLTMSPALLKKSLAAAKFVADHLVLKPQGFVFAPHPVVSETDRDKYCVQRIVAFYEQHRVDYAEYLLAAWRYRLREQSGRGASQLADYAHEAQLSPRYLETLWTALTSPESTGPLATVQTEWNKFPTEPTEQETAREAARKLSEEIQKLRKELDRPIEKLSVPGNSQGSQPLILWWNRQQAEQRMSYRGDGNDPALDAARDRFCHVFPNMFAVTSRGLYADPNLGANLRLLSAGFHLMQGYFRDDQPLCQLVLSEEERAELDTLWRELNFITHVPIRQYKDFVFFERAEPPRFMQGPKFDFARPEDQDVISATKLERLRVAYLERARENGASEVPLEAIDTYFRQMSEEIRWIEQTELAAEPSHLQSLLEFAQRAYRRPLSSQEREEWLQFYRTSRQELGLTHVEAMRDTLAAVLLSPHFYYRWLPSEGEAVRPLTGHELASRLSYFLWSSQPDAELLVHAATGDLQRPDVLKQQVQRMLQDDRVRGLALEFAGNWLEFRRFDEHNSVDRGRFPAFTDELRSAMTEEPIRFFVDVARRNRPLFDLIAAKDTFVNSVLAAHYGIPLPAEPQPHQWVHIDDATPHGRGGLLPMAAFLTRNSPGLRTSPVKRGYWVVRRLLGEHIPPPPPEVPELPQDEAASGELTLPQLLAKHRQLPACAGCHQRFDSLGLAFEGYGPVGEQRTIDLGGRAVETMAVYPDGSEGDGLAGLRAYLSGPRRKDFEQTFCRQLLTYALGRSLIPSDRPTLQRIEQQLQQHDGRFGVLIETIVTARQFLYTRGN